MQTVSSEGAAATLPSPVLTDSSWQRLSELRVYFAHQSVGGNIVNGIQELVRETPAARLRVVDGSPSAVQGPAFVHQLVGRNGDPRSKTAEFVAALDSAGSGTIALHKYCYVDVEDSTDVGRLFADYQRTIDAARARHPELTLVHVTMPLMAVHQPNPVKALVKKLIRKPESPEIARNALRNRFNDLLRREYAGREPVFDLARIESTLPDSSRSFLTREGVTIFTLASVYTDDGGHLNALGRRHVASQLLAFLVSL